jgi:predicted small integral membrane protein
MILRVAKIALIFAVALFYTFVVLNNVTDYDSNYQFVRHVLMMDSTFPANHGMWRAINSRAIHTAFYVSIIAWESITMLLAWAGGFRLIRSFSAGAIEFHRSKSVAVLALTTALLMWLLAFLSVGGEWFLMWQSRTWNGQDAAFRMFTVIGIVLMLVALPDSEVQP